MQIRGLTASEHAECVLDGGGVLGSRGFDEATQSSKRRVLGAGRAIQKGFEARETGLAREQGTRWDGTARWDGGWRSGCHDRVTRQGAMAWGVARRPVRGSAARQGGRCAVK